VRAILCEQASLQPQHHFRFSDIMSKFCFTKGEKMIYLIWLLRIIHIVGGVFWVGGVLTMTFFIGPTVGAIPVEDKNLLGT